MVKTLRILITGAAGALAALLLLGGCARERESRGDPVALAMVCGTLRVLRDTGNALAAPSPGFAWEPACPAVGLTVSRGGEGGDIVWTLGSRRGLRPPVRYGLTPAGAATQSGPARLERGVRYQARLEYIEAEYQGREDIILAPVVEFVP
jgi:hypothetical protein